MNCTISIKPDLLTQMSLKKIILRICYYEAFIRIITHEDDLSQFAIFFRGKFGGIRNPESCIKQNICAIFVACFS